MRSTPIYEVHAVKYAHLPRKAWEVQITPDPHDADFPMDYFVWVAIPVDVSCHRMLGGKRVVFHDGDEEIQPGLSVHLIGGHTMGMQSVRVMTRNGWLVLASDASHYYWGIEKKKLFAIVYSVADMLAGYDKLKKLADDRI